MNAAILLASSLLVVLLAVVLVREIRLRRGLQILLMRLLEHAQRGDAETKPDP